MSAVSFRAPWSTVAMRRLSVLLALLLIEFSASAALAADPWIGQMVFLKANSRPKIGDRYVKLSLISFPATVEAAKGNWLWIGRGWVPKEDVLTCRQALDYYSEEVRRNPTGVAAWIGRGKAWNQVGEPDKAIDDYTEALRLAPDDALAYDSRGNAWAAKGDGERAIQDHSEAIRLDPNNAVAYNNRGSAYYDRGDFSSAIDDYSDSIALDPNGATAYYNRGLAHAAKGEYDSAIDDYTSAMRLDPQFAGTYFERGNAWVKKDQVDNAIKDFAEAVRRNPRLAKAYVGRGLLWHQKHEYDNAVKDFTEAIRIEPLSAAAYNHRGNSCGKRGEFDNALKDFSEAIRLDPEYVSAYNNSAWLRATCPDPRYRDPKAAVAEASRACELSAGRQWQCLATLAAAYADKGDFKRALKVQAQAIDLAPTDKEKRELDKRLDRYKAKKPYREAMRRKASER
jgi:tetratricopeptide (TPR) repeat protein